jgi:hypothetical protein
MEWKDYISERLIAHHDNFYVIKPNKSQLSQPLFCPICENIMNTSYDDESWNKFECCDECSNHWVYPDMKRWKSGWRPSGEEVSDKKKRRGNN